MVKSLKHLLYLLKIHESDLVGLIKNIDSFYYEKISEKFNDDGSVKYKNGVKDVRIINPSIYRLKAIQKTICKSILSKVNLPNYAFGGVKGKDNIRNANLHKGKKYHFTTDLASFYPSINSRKVYAMFVGLNFSPDVAKKLTELTTYKGKVPQGAPCSSLIANLVFIKTGNDLLQLALTNNLTFSTFVDDLTFSSSKCFKSIIPQIIDIIKRDGYFINHRKTHYRTANKIVTGVKVGQNGISVTESFKEKIKSISDKNSQQYKGLDNYRSRIYAIGGSKKIVNK